MLNLKQRESTDAEDSQVCLGGIVLFTIKDGATLAKL